MSEKKWYAKPIYVMVALALVLSLGMTAVPWGSSEQVDAVIEPGQLVVEITWPNAVCEGDSFVIAANLTNIGEETIENVTATMTIDANASTTDPIKFVGDIEGGQWKVVTWIVKCERMGDSVITVTADGNNTEPAFATVAVFQIKCPPPHPSVDVYAPVQVYVGDDYYVTAVYSHFYKETVENVTATIVINGPASTTDSLTKAIGDIPAGESAEATWNLTCTGAGDVVVIVTAIGTDTNIAGDAAAIQQGGWTAWSNLEVSPTEGYAPLTITASAYFTNTGGTAVTTEAELYVDGSMVDSKIVTIGPGTWQTVSFDYTLDAGEVTYYEVTIDELPPVEVTVYPKEPPGWNCPLDHVALIAPYPGFGRPSLGASVDLSGVTCDADWFQVLWLDESSGEWLTYHSKFTAGNTLTTLEPDEFYYVVVSEPCELTVPQG